jgi:PIN domain nuclease of toxin-antitoxin system
MVMRYRPNTIVSAVTHQEVVTKLLRYGIPFQEIDIFLGVTFPTVIASDRQPANVAAQLHHEYRDHRVSYSDCSCLALAKLQGLPVLTGDGKWAEIPLKVDVKLFK